MTRTGCTLVAVLSVVALGATRVAQAQTLFVANHDSNFVIHGVTEYNGTTGASLGSFGAIAGDRAYGLALGPVGDVFVSYFDSGLIRRYNAGGALVDTFNPNIGAVRDIDFGPDGLLYVAGTSSIVRYNALTDTGLNVFNNSSLINPSNLQQMAFGPDGNLYVAAATFNTSTSGVEKFNHSTGAFMGVFVAGGSGGLGALPSGLTFEPDGTLIVGDEDTGKVLRYNGTTGAFIDSIAPGLTDPRALVTGPDGELYVAAVAAGDSAYSVRRYSGVSGAFLGTLVQTGSGGINFPDDLEFSPVRASAVPEPGQLALLFGGAVAGLLSSSLRLLRRRPRPL